LRGICSRNKFWRRYLRASDIDDYAESAWENVLPIAGIPSERVEVVLPQGLGVQVSPELRVLIYPFGWSTWLSFRIVGDHDLTGLATLTAHLLGKQAYTLASSPGQALTITDLFDRINKGVRVEAFGGKKAKPVNPQELLTVMTVLAKSGGGLSLGALEEDQELALKQILRPGGPVATDAITKFSEPLRSGNPLLNFVLHDARSWFIWAEHLLKPEGHNFAHLRCFHNNTFRSLQQVWELHNLLKLALATRTWSPALVEVIEQVLRLLGSPSGVGGYKNHSLLLFLNSAEFQASLAAAEKRLASADSH
ncbi:MAG TPA: hypothetical protein VF713_08735, partial [Thermoanaerobaculia bacterium]